MATMRLEIVTAERIVYSEDVDILVAPGIDGELGILPRHAPLLTVLKPGEIRVVKDGEDSLMAVSGGFLEVLGNKVTILADTAEREDEIDVQRAEEALKRAEERVATAPAERDLEKALASMRRSQARLRVARRRRRRGRRPRRKHLPAWGRGRLARTLVPASSPNVTTVKIACSAPSSSFPRRRESTSPAPGFRLKAGMTRDRRHFHPLMWPS